ncbi:unnamed protein product [Orchesella dallaii]|uniref:C2H2-type domain-containing protein n=1 Tax=Orchesella dallaii TaxID=48710 RepID=A0ABP1PRD1_9HEXA
MLNQCPLLFTTKSNCDRHVARKHSNAVTITVGNVNESSEPILRGKLSAAVHKEPQEDVVDETEEDDEEDDDDDYDGMVSKSLNKDKVVSKVVKEEERDNPANASFR